jgi:GNAT superfamily N-acetyltransferase
MKIRNAKLTDVLGMASAYVVAFKDVDPSERWTQESAEELVRFLLRSQPDLSFVAELDGEIVGGISGIAKPWWDGYHLVQTEIFLAPKGQRQGVGSALFYHFLNVAQAKYKATHMESITFKGLEFPSSWYIQLGFNDKDDWMVMFGDVKTLHQRLARKVEGLQASITIEPSGSSAARS